jgi:hypothetical protein
MARQQELLKKLKTTYLSLMRAKWDLFAVEKDMECDEPVPELLAAFRKAWFAAHERGLDPASVCVQIIRRYWVAPEDR